MASSTPEKLPSDTWAVVKVYTKALRKYPWLVPFPFIGTFILQMSALVAPLYMRQFINLLTESSPATLATSSLLIVLALFALANFVGWIGRRVQMVSHTYLESRVMADLADDAFKELFMHGHDFFINNFAGALTRRVNRYSRSFETIFDVIVQQFFSMLLFATGVLFVLGQRSALLALALFIWMVVFISLQLYMVRVRQPLRLASAKEDSIVAGILSDAVSNHAVVQTFATATYERSAFNTAVEKWRRALLKTWFTDEYIQGLQGLFAILIEVALLGGGVLLWKQGVITVGDFVLIQVYVLGLMDRIWGLGSSFRRLYQALADAYEMVQIFDTPYTVQDIEGAKPLSVTEGTIALDHIDFHFTEETPVLSDFNLTISGGEKLALVGHSGAGKSTITKILLRFFDVTKGSVTIDGQNIREVTQDSLHRSISFVPQDPTLFHRSLMENIRYGKPEATEEEVIEASKKAHCHDFISKLPEGYGTHVGERGVKLSGGERQRVAIARAILKNAPILILDEATSALDSESELLIQDALKILMEGKTVIVIAHRLSTIMSMDRIVVIENGTIAAQGTHSELLDQKGGLYHKLWSIQAGGFLTDDAVV